MQATTKSITVDSEVGIGTLRDLALELRDIRAGDLLSTTMPVAGTGTVKGASIVRLGQDASAALSTAVRDDTLDRYFADNGGLNDVSLVH